MDTILLLFWLQINIVVTLNLWGDTVVHMVFWLFCKRNLQRTLKTIPGSHLKLPRHVFSVLSLGLSLKICLPANPNKKAKTVSFPLQPTKLIFSKIYMLTIIANPL